MRENLQLMPTGIASFPVGKLRRGEELIGGVPQIRQIDTFNASAPLLCNRLERLLKALLVKEQFLGPLHLEALVPVIDLRALEVP